MKKNKMMRIASVLLVAVILTTCAISGTFAKYVTSGNGSDTARVAKFGVAITANGDTFADAYDKVGDGTGNSNKMVAYATAGSTVKSGIQNDDVVAPGTKGDMVSMTLSGTPEVAVKVTYAATVTLNDKWTDGANFYFPLVIKVNDTAVDLSGVTTAEGVKTAIANKVAEYSKTYDPLTVLDGKGAESLKISWEWPFEGNDVKDTYLGNQAAEGPAAEITIAVTTTVTQID